MKKPDLSSSSINKMETRKKKILFTEQEADAALQLIHLNNSHHTCPNSHHHHHHLHELSMKIVSKSEKFLQVQDLYNKEDESRCNIRKRKSDGIVSCCSSITFDLDRNSYEDARDAVSNHVKKMKKFRSVFDLYNVTKPL